MTSPIQRTPQTDKTLMPLRGEGNQPVKASRVINLEFEGDGLFSKEQIRQMISQVTGVTNFD